MLNVGSINYDCKLYLHSIFGLYFGCTIVWGDGDGTSCVTMNN